MIADQAQALREMARQATAAPRRESSRSRVIAIASGKGGVGKSNLCVNLAIRLASMNRRVVVLDADLGTANADVLCDLRPTSTLAHVVAGRRTLEQTMLDAPGGFRLAPGASGLASLAALNEIERARLLQQMRRLEHDADVILVDTGAGISPNVLSFAAGSDELLVVTTVEPTAVTDAYALIKAVHRQRPELGLRLLVNMVRDRMECREVFGRMDRVCRRFLGMNLRLAGYVPWDEQVVLAVRRRRPFVLAAPRCAAARCVDGLARRLDRQMERPAGQGLMQRMAEWWSLSRRKNFQ